MYEKKKFQSKYILLIVTAICIFVLFLDSKGYFSIQDTPTYISNLSNNVSSKFVINDKEGTEDNAKVQSPPQNDDNRIKLASSKKNVIYAYQLSNIDTPEKYTHIILAFVYTNNNALINSEDFLETADNIASFKEKYPNVNVMVAILGNGANSKLGTIIKDSSKRSTLVTSINNFINKYNLDGIDLDWEYYNNYSSCNPAYQDFASQLRTKLGTDKIISMAGQKASDFYASKYIVNMITNSLDFVSIMNYDFDTSMAKHNKVAYTGSYSQGKEVMQKYASALGADNKHKILMGIPFYGLKYTVNSDKLYEYGSSTVEFNGKYRFSLIADEIDLSKVSYVDNNGVAYYNNGKNLYTFDDTKTINTKIKYVVDNGYGGVMAWVASHDSNEILQNAVTTSLNELAPMP